MLLSNIHSLNTYKKPSQKRIVIDAIEFAVQLAAPILRDYPNSKFPKISAFKVSLINLFGIEIYGYIYTKDNFVFLGNPI